MQQDKADQSLDDAIQALERMMAQLHANADASGLDESQASVIKERIEGISRKLKELKDGNPSE